MRQFTAKIMSTISGNSIYIRNNIKSINYEALDRGSLNDIINWNIYSNRGSLTFIDILGEFKNLISLSENIKEIKVEIYLSSDIYDTLMATFFIEDFTYDEETKQAYIELTDGLKFWQDIDVPKIYPFVATTPFSLIHKILESVNISTFGYNTDTWLQDFYIDCPYLAPSNLWNDMNKICEATLCRIYTSEYGTPTISQQRPRYSKPIIIPPFDVLKINNRVLNHNTQIRSLSIATKNIQKFKDAPISETKQFELFDYENIEGVSIITNAYNNLEANKGLRIVLATTGNNPLKDDVRFDISTALKLHQFAHKIVPYNKTDSFGIVETYNGRYFGDIYRYASEGSNTYVFSKSPHQNLVSPDLRKDSSFIPQEFEQVETDENMESCTVSFTIYAASPQMKYFVSKGSVSVNGDYFEEKTDITVTYPTDSTAPPTPLSSNELIQFSSAFSTDGVKYANRLLKKVYDQFKNGVECIELECIIDDYYFEDSTLAISANEQNNPIYTFKKYDTVIPYATVNGIGKPISTKEDGTPKEFTIIGIKYSYDGVIKQTLWLQEKTI